MTGSFRGALGVYYLTGDLGSLDLLLHSDEPLTAEDRDVIFQVVTGKLKRPRGRAPWGRAYSKSRFKDLPLHAAFFEVERLKDEAKAKGSRIANGDAVAIAAKKYGVDENKLYNLTRRPREEQPWTELVWPPEPKNCTDK